MNQFQGRQLFNPAIDGGGVQTFFSKIPAQFRDGGTAKAGNGVQGAVENRGKNGFSAAGALGTFNGFSWHRGPDHSNLIFLSQ